MKLYVLLWGGLRRFRVIDILTQSQEWCRGVLLPSFPQMNLHRNHAIPAQQPKKPRGFSLVELLTVVGVITILMGLAGPMVRSLAMGGGVNRSAADLAQVLELSRVYAMANRTYVRTAIGEVAPTGGRVTPSIVVLPIASNDGSLGSDSAAAMTDPAQWSALRRPVVLENLQIYDSLVAALGSSTLDALPGQSDIDAFTRRAGDLGDVEFRAFIQFQPNGEVRVVRDEPTRYIHVGLDQPATPASPTMPRNQDPLVIRVSGINGTVTVLRKEDL